jgi:hypothetical protein
MSKTSVGVFVECMQAPGGEINMSNQKRNSHRRHHALLVLMIAALVAVLAPASSLASDCGTYSGDGPYDPAACDPLESPAVVGTYSGDDAYDPAAGGLPHLPSAVSSPGAMSAVPGTYSGDDPYDPAAGGLGGDDESAVCALTAGEIARRIAARTTGGFSGDDAYDPAAGGTPELSVASSEGAPGQLAACVPATLDGLTMTGFDPAEIRTEP